MVATYNTIANNTETNQTKRKGKKMKLTTEEAKHLLEELNYKREYDEICDTDLAILAKAKAAYPLAVAQIELEENERNYLQLMNYHREVLDAFRAGKTWEQFLESRKTANA